MGLGETLLGCYHLWLPARCVVVKATLLSRSQLKFAPSVEEQGFIPVAGLPAQYAMAQA